MARIVHVEAPTAAGLQATGSAPTTRYVAHDHDVPDEAGVGTIVTVEGKTARVKEASATMVVVVILP